MQAGTIPESNTTSGISPGIPSASAANGDRRPAPRAAAPPVRDDEGRPGRHPHRGVRGAVKGSRADGAGARPPRPAGRKGPMTKTAVVTGASSGIGAATARRLAAEGYHVVAAARRVDRLNALVKEITKAGGAATAVPCDVTSDDSAAGLATAVAELPGPLTLLVNTAGG